MPQIGGQCIKLYPDKPIYAMPAIPVCDARELIIHLQQQIEPFAKQFHLGTEVIAVTHHHESDHVHAVRY